MSDRSPLAAARALPAHFDPHRWVPSSEVIEQYHVTAFLRESGCADMQELMARAARSPEWFYPRALEFVGAEWLGPWNSVRQQDVDEAFTRWFVGAKTNLAWLAAARWIDNASPAIIWDGEDGAEETWSFADVDRAVRSVIAALQDLGVSAGDTVGMHLPVVPAALILMLAVAGMGAIVVPAFSGFGAEALRQRLELAGAKVLVTADGTLRRGRVVDMLATGRAAAAQTPTVQRVIVVSRLGELDLEPSELDWSDLLAHEPVSSLPSLDSDTPWLIAFTSGSTGQPKGAVHTHGGAPYGLMVAHTLSGDIGPGDRFSWPADMGYFAGTRTGLSPLTLGATAVLIEGALDFPDASRIWRSVERHAITHLGLTPTSARMMASSGPEWVEPFDLDTLRIIVSGGEPWTTPAWEWVHRHIGRGVRPIINWSGGTEIGGDIVSCYPNMTFSAGEFNGPQLGMYADVVDAQGNSVRDQPGELVLRRSWPNMTKALWQDPERYVREYWSAIPGLWVHGDRAVHRADGSFEISGRSDDVLKIAGKRVGPSELESAAMQVEGVTGAVAIGLPDPTKGEALVVVVTSNADAEQDQTAAVTQHLVAVFGKALKPAAVVRVSELPMGRAGKVHRRILRGWIAGTEPGDLTSLDNPDCSEEIIYLGAQLRRRLTGADHG